MNRHTMRRLTRRSFLALSTLGLVGCALRPTVTPAPTARPLEPTAQGVTPEPTITTAPVKPTRLSGQMLPVAALAPKGFAALKYEPVSLKPIVGPYKLDPRATQNAESWLGSFSPAQIKMLEDAGFTIAPGASKQIYDIYVSAKHRGSPVFVSTDALLHAYHILYDYTLRRIELDHFVADLKGLLGAMQAATEAQLKAAGKLEPLREAATRNLAFFAVAASLLDPATQPPKAVVDQVQQELALIDAHQGLADSPIFGYKEDYSQYVPRGHYTRNETFQRYFRAMMWLGRIMFRLRPGSKEADLAQGRLETRQAILIVAALGGATVGSESAAAVWERIYEPTVFFVGQTDDLNIYDYADLTVKAFGETLSLAALADDGKVDAFIAEGLKLRPPRIVSSLVYDLEKPEEVTKGFRFMGQRFVPDSLILQQLVYDKVLFYQGKGSPFTMVPSQAGPIRGFPRGLDIAAVLGSERALVILKAEGDTGYNQYDEQMTRLRAEFASLPQAQWTQNLYWDWLHTLRPLLEQKGEGYPAFMRNQAWLDKELNAFLGSWAELRHDTLLYAKQSMTVGATAARPEEQPFGGYVEPEVEVWNRLLFLVRQMREGLSARGLLPEEFANRLARLDDLVAGLLEISKKELTLQALTPEESDSLTNIGFMLQGITTFEEKTETEITSAEDERMAIVADVHTDPNSGQVLEEAVGDPATIWVVVPGPEGKTYLTVGGVFSYYEFKQPMSDRLTDSAWQTRLAADPKPAFAPWQLALMPK